MPAVTESRYLVQAGWDDVPHLDEKTKRELLDATLPYLRDARSKGTPSLGSGAIYPIPESEFVVDPFAIPPFWPKAFGFDVGWKRTACIWGALDRNVDVLYLFAEHYRGEAPPSTHATAVKARGEWIPGVIDPAARGRSQRDGEQLMYDYKSLGLDLVPADNSVESGLYNVYERLNSGRLKVFSTCRNWLAEFRLYRRDEKGRIVKENDHLMDATRYLVKSGVKRAIVEPVASMDFHPGANVGDADAGY